MTGRTTAGRRTLGHGIVIRRSEAARARKGAIPARAQRSERRGLGCVLPGTGQPGASLPGASQTGASQTGASQLSARKTNATLTNATQTSASRLKRGPGRRKPDPGVISGTVKRGPGRSHDSRHPGAPGRITGGTLRPVPRHALSAMAGHQGGYIKRGRDRPVLIWRPVVA
jgi:hypothetical protein